MEFQTCLHCHNEGLIHANSIGTQDRYVFRCSCSFGLVKDKAFPIWGRPTKGFTVIEWPKPTATPKPNAMASLLVINVDKNPFDEDDL
jgi:hypothetical protein